MTDGLDKVKQATTGHDNVMYEAFGSRRRPATGKVEQEVAVPTREQAGHHLLLKDVKRGSACGVACSM